MADHPDKILRWGLLCTAHINRALIPAIRNSQRSRLVSVASRTREKAINYAQAWEIPRWHDSYESLLSDPEIDVIYNSLPNALHAKWTIKALQAGKHVLCEKPIVLSVSDVDQLSNISHDTSRVVSEAFMYLHHPQTRKVKELIQGGEIGTLRFIRGSFTYVLTDENNVRMLPSLGGGSLWDVGCYPISYARYILESEPEQVFGWQTTSPTGIDLSFVGQMKFPGDIHAQFDCSFVTPYTSYMEFVGTQGSLHIPAPYKPGIGEIIHLTRDDQKIVLEIEGEELYSGEVRDLEEAILHQKPSQVSLMFSRGNIRTITSLYESALNNKPVVMTE